MKTGPSYFQIPEPRPSANRRFFAFHHAGGAAAAYAKFKNHLSLEYELVLAELPGRGKLTSFPFFKSWEELTDNLSRELARIHDRPSIFFGHSMGGIVAYELLARLDSFQSIPSVLAVSAINAPSHLQVFKIPQSPASSDAELLHRIRETGGAPIEVLNVPGLIEQYLPILRTDLRLLGDYTSSKSTKKIREPIVVYRPTIDPWITPNGIARWADFTHSSFRVQFREGNHFYLFDQLPSLITDICSEANGL